MSVILIKPVVAGRGFAILKLIVYEAVAPAVFGEGVTESPVIPCAFPTKLSGKSATIKSNTKTSLKFASL